MKSLEIYEKLPWSEQTLIRHNYIWDGIHLINDIGHPCEYRMIKEGKDYGIVKYYKGRKLTFYGYAREGKKEVK